MLEIPKAQSELQYFGKLDCAFQKLVNCFSSPLRALLLSRKYPSISPFLVVQQKDTSENREGASRHWQPKLLFWLGQPWLQTCWTSNCSWYWLWQWFEALTAIISERRKHCNVAAWALTQTSPRLWSRTPMLAMAQLRGVESGGKSRKLKRRLQGFILR